VAALAHLEATIDFADEDLAPQTGPEGIFGAAHHNIWCIRYDITQYIVSSHHGERLRSGLAVAIVGAPNVGKSSLLNALARRDAAIVSEVAGTTRDVIEVHLDLAGYPLTLADTAGLHGAASADDRPGPVEAEGMRRARARATAADLKVAVFDILQASQPDPETLALIDDNTLVVLNKRDLTSAAGPDHLSGRPAISVSAKTGAGMAALETALGREAESRLAMSSDSPLFTRARHRQALVDCAAALERAGTAPLAELAAEDVRLALRALGRIAGRVDVEDILDVVFRDFCIGK
jgi:tRNA modification GTPase